MKRAVMCIALMGMLAGPANAQEVKYTTHIKPVFDAKCGSCHGKENLEYEVWKKDAKKLTENMVGMKMDTFRTLIAYVLWPNTGALMRRLDNGQNSKEGKPGNMYEFLGATKEEREKNLSLFKQWVPVWKLGRIGDLSKEEILMQDKLRDRF